MQNDDFKTQARRLRTALAGRGVALGHNDTQHLIAQAHGYPNWQTARAAAPTRAPVAIHAWFAVTFASAGRRGVDINAPRLHPSRDAALDAAAAALSANVYSEAGFDLDAFDEETADEGTLQEFRALQALEAQALAELDAARATPGDVTVHVPQGGGEPFTVSVHQVSLPVAPPRTFTLRAPGQAPLTVDLSVDDHGGQVTLAPLDARGVSQGQLRLTCGRDGLRAEVFTRQDDEHDRDASAQVTLHHPGPLRVFHTALDGQRRHTWTVGSAAELLEQLNDHDSIWDVPTEVAQAAWTTGQGEYRYRDGRVFQVTERDPSEAPVAGPLFALLDLTPGTIDPDGSDVATALDCLQRGLFDSGSLVVYSTLAALLGDHGRTRPGGVAPVPQGRRRYYLRLRPHLDQEAFTDAFTNLLRDSNIEDDRSFVWHLDTFTLGSLDDVTRQAQQ